MKVELRHIEKLGSHGAILYDGACGVCSHFIGNNSSFFERYGYTTSPLQEDWVSDFVELKVEDLTRTLHLVRPDGSVVIGADVYRDIFTKIFWLKPIALLSRLPILRSIFDWAYATFAARRKNISQVCGLQSKAKFKD